MFMQDVLDLVEFGGYFSVFEEFSYIIYLRVQYFNLVELVDLMQKDFLGGY